MKSNFLKTYVKICKNLLSIIHVAEIIMMMVRIKIQMKLKYVEARSTGKKYPCNNIFYENIFKRDIYLRFFKFEVLFQTLLSRRCVRRGVTNNQ